MSPEPPTHVSGRNAAGTSRWSGVTPQLDMLLTLVDALPPVAYWDCDLRARMVNEAFCEFFGISAHEADGRHLSELLFPDVVNVAMPHFQLALTGKQQLFERVTVDPSGASNYAQVSLIPDMVDGVVRGVIAIATDITAHRDAEMRLAATESRFKLTLMASPVGIATLHRDGRLSHTNPSLARIVGCAPDELEGRCLGELVTLDEPGLREQLERFGAGQLATATIECEAMRADGSSAAVILNLAHAPERLRGDGDGDDSILGVVQLQDITARKRAEEQLRRSQERLEQAEAMARMGTWEWDLRRRRGSYSAGLRSILKLDDACWGESVEETLERVHPDDRERVRDTLERAVKELVSVSLELRIARADGRVRMLDLHADPIVDEHGEPVRLIAVLHDMTESKRAQAALSTASTHLAKYAIELQELAAAAEGAHEQPAGLSPRQTETLRLVAQGLTNAEIAKRMFVSEATVKWHIQQILAKTNSVNRTEAVVRVLGITARPGDLA